MSLNLGSAHALLTLDSSGFVNGAKAAANAATGVQQATSSLSGDGGFLNWVTANEAALSKWGKGMMAVGAIMTGFLAAPIIAGSKAAWGQVDAVEQATIAMNAYADSTEQVDAVLAALLDYARSDMGVLFSRQELFSAAQSMLIYGASIEDVTGYTEILSRSVGLGLSDWDSLNTIIGRVGSTGRLTGNDFDMLKQRGFDLDESLRNTNITWEELFVALDKGIPADALAGQADTIRGKSIRLQSALRGLGLAFLGVDSETSKFIEGGLGWQMMRGLERVTEGLKRMAPAVGRLGDIFASIGRPIGAVVDFILRLPQPVQTAILLFTALAGAVLTVAGGFLAFLPVIAPTILAVSQMGGAMAVLSKGVMGLLAPVRLLGAALMAIWANPILLAGAVAIGAAILAYKTNFMGFGDMVRDALGWVQDLWAALQSVFGTPSSKTISIYDDWQADEYTIKSTTLPDGTKVWNIVEDETGETFGEVLESYTDYDGTTYILIQPEGDGPAFWTKADLETGKPEKIGIPLVAEDAPFQGRIAAIKSATGNEVTVVINGDGEPIGTVLDEIITDPVTGTKTVTIQMGDGTTFTAEVDELKGTITPLDIEVEAGEMSEVEEMAGRINTMADNIRGAWLLFNAAIEGTILLAQDLWGWLGKIEGVANAVGDALEWALGEPAKDENNDGRVPVDEQYPGLEPGPDLSNHGQAEGRTRHVSTQTGTPGAAGNLGALAGLIANVEESYRRAVPAVTGFGSAMAGTQAPMQQSEIDMNKIASTAPVVGGSMATADAQVKGAGAGIGGTFAGIAASALANFPAAQAIATSQFAAMQSGTLASAIGMSAGVAARMAALQSSVTSQASSARANAVSQFSTLASNAAGKFMGMQAQSAVQMALMAAQASTQGAAVNTNLSNGVSNAISSVRGTLAQLSGIVMGAGANAAWQALMAGANIGNSFASGMESALGRIRGAAAAMVAAAMVAVQAKAMIASPSKVFKRYGGFVGEGFELGILNSIPDIRRAADAMLSTGMPSPAFSAPFAGGGGYGGGTTVIDNTTHNETFITLNDAQFGELLAAKDKANAMYRHATSRRNPARYEG